MSTSEGKAMTIDDTKRDVASHILPDGTFINLPAATERDRAMFFARSIANFKLISANPLDRSRGTSSSAPPEDIEKFGVNNSATIDSKPTKKLSSEYVHPLAVASARLQGVGAAELSKAINLSTLVGDYFSLANVITDDAATLAAAIVSSSAIENADLKSGGSAASLDKTKTPASAMLGSDQQQTVEEATRRLKEDQRLRALYLLRRKKLAYSGRISCKSDNSKNASSQTNVNGASQILSKHEESLRKSLKRQRVIDCRLLDLRKRWKLSLPDHGTKVIAPVQPHELVAVDVEMYENKQNEQSQPGNMYSLKESPSFLSAQKAQSNLDRVAKLVPRYATIELKENADLTKIANELSNRLSDDKDGEASSKRRSDLSAVTIAEPLTMLDASFRQLDNLMDPNKVEMLTLIVRVEKESTGFSLSVIPAKGDMSIIDDATIMSLQHSLFCASLFDSIRQEIMSSVTDTNNIKSGLSSTLLTTSTAWLPACMDESFLPPPSRMASNGSFCIVHSQEGEVKIRLDSEYSLTLKLMEVGAAVELCEKERHISSTKTRCVFQSLNVMIIVSFC